MFLYAVGVTPNLVGTLLNTGWQLGTVVTFCSFTVHAVQDACQHASRVSSVSTHQ